MVHSSSLGSRFGTVGQGHNWGYYGAVHNYLVYHHDQNHHEESQFWTGFIVDYSRYLLCFHIINQSSFFK